MSILHIYHSPDKLIVTGYCRIWALPYIRRTNTAVLFQSSHSDSTVTGSVLQQLYKLSLQYSRQPYFCIKSVLINLVASCQLQYIVHTVMEGGHRDHDLFSLHICGIFWPPKILVSSWGPSLPYLCAIYWSWGTLVFRYLSEHSHTY